MLFLSKIEYKCFYQLDNWISVSTSGHGQRFDTFFFFFPILLREECSSMKSDNKNNSAELVGRKHFLSQKSIGKESDLIFHLRQITITEPKSAHLEGAVVTYTSIRHYSRLGVIPNTGERLIKLILWDSDKMTECSLSAPEHFPLPSIFSVAVSLLFSISLTYILST